MKRLTAILLALLFLLTACATSPPSLPLSSSLDFSGLQDENGDFVPRNLIWQMSVDEAREAIGNALLGRSVNVDETSVPNHYYAESAVSWGGCTGDILYGFSKNGLWSVEYVFKNPPNDISQLYESLLAHLTELYGEPYSTHVYDIPASDSHDAYQSETADWRPGYWEGESGDIQFLNALGITKVFASEENYSVSVGLNMLSTED